MADIHRVNPRRPAASYPKCANPCARFNPPRDTQGSGSPQTSRTSAAPIPREALSTTVPLTKTAAASISMRARARLAASPRATNA